LDSASNCSGSASFGDIGDGVLAQPQFAADQAVAATLADERQHLWREAV
jgi:hypothetical protein